MENKLHDLYAESGQTLQGSFSVRCARCGYRINHQKLMVPEVLFQTWSSKTCIPESSLTGLARASLPEKVPKRENEFRGAVKHLN